MKFSHVIQFNAVPEWADSYINYTNLKKLLYSIERDIIVKKAPPLEASRPDESRLLLTHSEEAEAISSFVAALDHELDIIEAFYRRKERELFAQVDLLEREASKRLYRGRRFRGFGSSSNSPDSYRRYHNNNNNNNVNNSDASIRTTTTTNQDDIPTASDHQQRPKHTCHPSTRAANGNGGSYSHSYGQSPFSTYQATDTTPAPTGPHDSPPENTGQNNNHHHIDFDAITPKNITNANIPATFSSSEETCSSTPSSEDIPHHCRHDIYHDLRNQARDMFILLHDLRSYARLNFTGFSKILKKFDKVTGLRLKDTYMENQVLPAYPFSTNTRKQLVKRVEAVTRTYARASGESNIEAVFNELKGCLRQQIVWDRNTIWRDMINLERRAGALEVQEAPVETGSGLPFKAVRPFSTRVKTLLYFTACTSAFLLLLAFGPWFTADAQQHRCWAMLVYVSLLWATETFPLHVTALMVPLLVVVLRVMRDPTKNGLPLDSRQSTKAIFAAMFSPVIMLLLGGFTIAAALSKHNIARIIASWVLSKAGTQPRNVLLVSIFVATFASMWISNVAAPVLCFSLIQPILRTLPLGSSYAQCLILGIALASNVGGMASPIASPQNIIAINTMHPSPSWLQWFFVSLPICVVSDMLIWLLLVLVYRPNRSTPNINQIRYTPQRLNPIQIYICVIAGVTILLWCVEAKLQWLFGDMGVIAILPLVLFFCHPAVLTKEDFNNFLWTVIILAMGGIALGAAVESSGLLHVVAGQIDLAVRGMPLFLILCTVCGLILIVCTFISHTVGSLIILPIVAEVGAHLPVPHARLLVMGSALMASGAMGLPVSGFPNMNAVMLEDSMGKRYLTTKDFFRVGIPASIVTYLVIVSIGFVLMYMLGF